MNSVDFAKYWNAAASNAGEALPFTDEILEEIEDHYNGITEGEPTTTWQGYTSNEPWAIYWFVGQYRLVR